MRQNNRSRILDAAVRVVERDGLRGLTLEATAETAGLTRGGMMYHFRDREALQHALHEHLAAQWDEQLTEKAGKPASDCTPDERITAYALAVSENSTSAELALLLDAAKNPTYAAIWDEVQRRWTPTPDEAATDARALDRFVVRLAADGLWAYEATNGSPLTPALRQSLARRIATLLSADAQQD